MMCNPTDYYGYDVKPDKPKSPTMEACQYCPGFTVSGKRMYCSQSGQSIVFDEPLPVRCREKLRLKATI